MSRDAVIAILRAHEADLRGRGVVRAALFGSAARGEASAASDLDILAEIDRAADVFVVEEGDVRGGAAVAVAHDNVAGDGLETGAEVLARLDQHVAPAGRVDAAVGEDAEVVGLAALLADHDLHGAGVEHG